MIGTIPARVLTVAGSDSGGGAGIQADLKVFATLGVYGMTAVTALTAQNTTGVHGVLSVPPAFVRRQIEVVLADIGADAVKTGMLGNAEIVRAVVEAVREHAVTHLVVDPVMVAQSGDRLLDGDAVAALRDELIPHATVVTPNLPEAEALLGRRVRSLAEMRDAAQGLVDHGAAAALVKGGHASDRPAIDVLHDGRETIELRAPRIESPHTHGTGCMTAAAIAAGLAEGMALGDAVQRAKEMISAAIEAGLPLGRGAGPANPLAYSGKSGS